MNNQSAATIDKAMAQHPVPTIGRIVHYVGKDNQTRAAVVTWVWGVFCLNLFVFPKDSSDPESGIKTSVTHLDAPETQGPNSWHWMPYQKQVAAGEIPAVKHATTTTAMVEFIARVCHEVNRGYCQALGDTTQLPWEEAPLWQRSSAMKGVELHLSNPNAGPQASHESWMAQKIAEGWVYGEKKDPANRTHPCLLPFDSLPVEQKAKDHIFRAVVHALKV